MTTPPYLSGTLKRRLASGDTLGLIWLSLGHASIAELAAWSGADAVVLDLQHGLWQRDSLETAIGVSAHRAPVLARTSDDSAYAIGSALDAGADGVLVPMVETAEQAARAISAARFPPRGTRSGGGVRPIGIGFSDYLARAEGIVSGLMIETLRGVQNADTIAAVEGVDFVLIGTGDLSISCAAAGGGSAEVEAACKKVLAACRHAGVACGIFTSSTDEAIRRRAEGYRLVVLANDIDAITNTFGTSTERFRKDL